MQVNKKVQSYILILLQQNPQGNYKRKGSPSWDNQLVGP